MTWLGHVALFLFLIIQVTNGKSRHSRSDTSIGNKLPPYDLKVERTEERTIDLSWTESNTGVQGYYVIYQNHVSVNRTAKILEPKTKIHLSELGKLITLSCNFNVIISLFLEPGSTYRIWVTGYQVKDNLEVLGPSSSPLDVETVRPLEPPNVVKLSCIPPDELLIEWTSVVLPDLYFALRFRAGNVSSYSQRFITPALDFHSRQQYSLFNQTLEGWYEIGLMSVESEKNSPSGKRESNWSKTQTIFCNDGVSAAESTDVLAPNGSSIAFTMILGCVISVILLFMLLALFFWRKFYSGSYYYLDNPSVGVGSQGTGGWEGDDSTRAAVEIQLFPNHVTELHRDGDIGFSKEYEVITGVEEDFSSIHSSHPDNKLKNRYLNILAYDHTRVRLENCGSHKKSNDYVNGNYIDGFERPRAYIGTQGPLPSTFEAFWQLVWENRVSVIVMITNLTERGRRKCDQYWPLEGAITYGLVQVHLLKEETMATYILRTFTVKYLKSKKQMNCDERLVWQFHYTVWPDHGTPSHPLPVLSFVRKSSAASPSDAGPIIVHCSAGVGRTGTYIVLDAMLRQIAKRGDLNIFGFLRHIRRQRNFLVQTEEQYIFCHDALLEAIQSGETNVSLSRLPQYLKNLRERTYLTENNDVISMFQRQYDLVTGRNPTNQFFLVANKKCNATKNRIGALKPTDNSRVLLIPKPGVDGSDYINASFLPGFSRIREFILTPHPMELTVRNFWQMLCDHNISSVVLLALVDENEFPVFWPEGDVDMELDGVNVKFLNESHRLGIVTRSFAVIQEGDDELHVDFIQSLSWPYNSSTATDLFELIQFVQDALSEVSSTGPIVVVDRYGGTEGATFCTLSTICNQLDAEAHLDIYLYSKLYHDQRPGIWPSFSDYSFLYESIDGLTKGRRNSEPLSLNGPIPSSPIIPLTRAPPPIPATQRTEPTDSINPTCESPEPASLEFDEEAQPELTNSIDILPLPVEVQVSGDGMVSYEDEKELSVHLIPYEQEDEMVTSKQDGGEDGPEESVD